MAMCLTDFQQWTGPPWRDNNHSMATAKNLVFVLGSPGLAVFSWTLVHWRSALREIFLSLPLAFLFKFTILLLFYFSFNYGKSALRTLVICVCAYILYVFLLEAWGPLTCRDVSALRWLLTSHMWVTSCLGCSEYDCCRGDDMFDLISVFVLLIIRSRLF